MLAQVARALGEQGVSIRAFMASNMDGRGFVRLVVDRPAQAAKVLRKHGWELTVDEVVEVTTADKPGAVSTWPDGTGRPRSATVVIRKADGGVIGA